jgi:hypothetical protein
MTEYIILAGLIGAVAWSLSKVSNLNSTPEIDRTKIVVPATYSIIKENTYDDLFKTYGAIYNVPWHWLKAIACVESALGRYKGKSSDGYSYGLMQMTVTTAKSYLKTTDNAAAIAALLNDEASIELSAMYMENNIKLFGITNVKYCIMGYNQNPYNLIKNPPIEIPAAAQYYEKWLTYNTYIKLWENIL